MIWRNKLLNDYKQLSQIDIYYSMQAVLIGKVVIN